MTEKVLIHLHNISTKFGRQVVHKDVNLDIKQSEILGIVGGSGSGKSVLLRLMIGLDRPHRGSVQYASPKPEMGVLFQSGALISSLTVLENIAIPLREVAKVSESLSQELSLIKLLLVGLKEDDAQKFPAQLSGGMIKRAGLARAMALDPDILFLDEPTSGLDPVSAAGIDELIKDLQRKLAITVVMVTHDLDTLATICDRIAVLVDHQIIVGTRHEIASLDHPWIKSYFQGMRGQRLFGSHHGQ